MACVFFLCVFGKYSSGHSRALVALSASSIIWTLACEWAFMELFLHSQSTFSDTTRSILVFSYLWRHQDETPSAAHYPDPPPLSVGWQWFSFLPNWRALSNPLPSQNERIIRTYRILFLNRRDNYSQEFFFFLNQLLKRSKLIEECKQ